MIEEMISEPEVTIFIPDPAEEEVVLSMYEINKEIFNSMNGLLETRLELEAKENSVLEIVQSTTEVKVGELYYNTINSKVCFSGKLEHSVSVLANYVYFYHPSASVLNKRKTLILVLGDKELLKLTFDNKTHKFKLLILEPKRVSEQVITLFRKLENMLNQYITFVNSGIYLEA